LNNKIDPRGLLAWQPAPAQHLLDTLLRNGAAVDGSDTGVGKTFQAGAVMRAMDMPTLVICPRVAITPWKRMGDAMGIEFDVINWEMVRTGNTPYCKFDSSLSSFEWSHDVHFLVFDEIHRASGTGSWNAELVIAAKRQRIYTLGLSATLGDDPTKFRAIGYLLGLHTLVDSRVDRFTIRPGFDRWLKKHGCSTTNGGSYYFQGSDSAKRAMMLKINSKIFPERGARVRVSDLGDAFPDRQIFAELYDMGSPEQINALFEQMAEALEELKTRAAFDKDPNHPMTRLIRARQQVELLKVPTFVSLAQDALAQDYSVVLFVNFQQTLNELRQRLNINCFIDGTQQGEKGLRQRDAMIDIFQENKERIIVANTDAGGVALSLHDKYGGFPRVGYVSLGWSATKTRQLFGRLHRAGAKSKALYRCLLAAGTVEERVHRALAPKLNRLDALMDGDLDACNLELTSHVDNSPS
jgi:hypothetical protein